MLAVVAAGLLLAFVALYDYVVVGGRLVAGRRGRAWPAVAGALAIAYVIPVEWTYVRIIAAVFGITMAAKSYEYRRQTVADPTMVASLGRFLFWLIFPPDSRAPRGAADRARARRAGRIRLARGLAKGAAVWALLRLSQTYPELHENLWIGMHWALWLTYFAVSGITDLGSGAAMQSGYDLAETFDAPPLARSPRDFWSRRWNLFIHRFAMRNVFLPLGGTRRPLLAMGAVFLLSGVMHEYFIVAVLGRLGGYTGWMMTFFGLQGLAVIAEVTFDRVVGRRHRLPAAAAVAVAVHLCWLTATAPLFFVPLAEIFRGT